MDSIEKWLFPGTPISTLLRFKPMALSLLEKYGMDPWDPNRVSVEEVCVSKGIPLETFFAEMKALPAPAGHTEWALRPISQLIEYLTRDHRHLVHVLMPAIKSALSQEYASDWESMRRIRYLVEEWPAFAAALEEHIQEEEAFLFPKILQYDHSLRHKRSHPDFHGGSVNVYVALRMLGNEERQMTGVRRFLNEVSYSKESLDRPGTLENRLGPLLEELQTRLSMHAALETKVLFPMAKAVEKALMDVRIAGAEGGNEREEILIPT
jgi:iron-sulfur cluster repair protein YtfE (RIC family)